MKKTLIAFAAAATLAVGFSATANADPFGFGIGFGGYGHPHFGISINEGYGPNYYNAGYYGDNWNRPRCHTEWVQGWYQPHRVLVCRR